VAKCASASCCATNPLVETLVTRAVNRVVVGGELGRPATEQLGVTTGRLLLRRDGVEGKVKVLWLPLLPRLYARLCIRALGRPMASVDTLNCLTPGRYARPFKRARATDAPFRLVESQTRPTDLLERLRHLSSNVLDIKPPIALLARKGPARAR